jgi:hypothetical protein
VLFARRSGTRLGLFGWRPKIILENKNSSNDRGGNPDCELIVLTQTSGSILAMESGKRILLLVALGLSLAAQPSERHFTAHDWVTGSGVTDTKLERLIYTSGFVEGFLIASNQRDPAGFAEAGLIQQGDLRKTIEATASCVKPMTFDQVEAIIDQYIQAHPERWNEYRGFVVTMSLVRACKEKMNPAK